MKGLNATPSHRGRVAALIALSVALAVQIIWLAGQLLTSQMPLSQLTRSIIFTAAFLAIAVTYGRHRVINTVGRFVIVGAFLLALWNRFDNFSGFVRYTGLVNSFMPAAVIPAVAVLATIAEISCCLLMLIGLKLRLVAAASGTLLFMFASAMTISGLEQFTWAVYVLATGGWMLATVDASLLSLDALLFSKEKETTWNSPVVRP